MLEPIKKSDWNPSLAAHLLNRAGFGATPETIATFAALSPADAVGRIVYYESAPDFLPAPPWTTEPDADLRPDRESLASLSDEERRKRQQERRRDEMELMIYLRQWWLKRMRSNPNPLEEKLTLFWHGHFATSFEKVRSAYAIYLQNQTFRRLASGNWRDLIVAVSQDPAMLFYLDNAKSRKGHPNENYARELMELFTLGEGNYTEKDVQESARAFTGWSIDAERVAFQERPRQHDDGDKTFMTRSGPLDAYDVIDEILARPACAAFISRKMWRYFAYEDVEPELEQELAATLRDGGYEFRPFLEKMFLSRAFYAKKSAYSQIKSPVQWLVGSAILLEDDLPGGEECSMITKSLGQELFVPPNVKGWNGGYSWITTSSLVQRYNLAGFLVKGAGEMVGTRRKPPDEAMEEMAPMARARRSLMSMAPIGDLEKILPASKRKSLDTAWEFLEWRMYQRKLAKAQSTAVRQYLTKLPMPAKWDDDQLRNILHVMMSSPYYQVC